MAVSWAWTTMCSINSRFTYLFKKLQHMTQYNLNHRLTSLWKTTYTTNYYQTSTWQWRLGGPAEVLLNNGTDWTAVWPTVQSPSATSLCRRVMWNHTCVKDSSQTPYWGGVDMRSEPVPVPFSTIIITQPFSSILWEGTKHRHKYSWTRWAHCNH